MFCPTCGVENSADSKFCIKCGSALPEEIESSSPALKQEAPTQISRKVRNIGDNKEVEEKKIRYGNPPGFVVVS